jgi:3-isopropylmalate dehydrogenase
MTATNTQKLLLLPGDGIGPEVTAQVRRVAQALTPDLTLDERPFGGASYDLHGTPLTDEALAAARASRAVLMGAVGGPKWVDAPRDRRPEAGLLALRAGMGVFANLRPALCFQPLADASSLKREVVEGLDFMIVRELTGGIYFGSPRFIEDLPGGGQRAVDTQVYTTAEIERVARVAFELARKRQNRLCSVEKANVMESGLLWRQTVTALHKAEYADVELSHMYADNCAMQLVRNPRQFDVIVTGNLFGDILSDLASMLTGSLGMLPSATLGAVQGDGRRHALYEPIHGSAPDIAGKGVANPLAQMLSFAMLLRYSFGMEEDAAIIERACTNVLASGLRTPDVMAPGCAKVSTSVMGEAVVRELDKLGS